MDDPASAHAHFYRIGLSRNPFGALTREEWVDVVVLPESIRELVNGDYDVVQVLGEKGRGKTTTLLWLAARLEAHGKSAHYERLEIGQRRPTIDLSQVDHGWLLIDEAQRLGIFARKKLLSLVGQGVHVVLGSHADWSRRLANRGLRVSTVALSESQSRESLAAIIEARIEYFALPDSAIDAPRLSPQAVDWLWGTFGDDVRSALDQLYEVYQHIDAPGPVTLAQVRADLRSGRHGSG